MYSFSLTLKFLKNGARICPLYPSAFTVSEKKMGLIILDALRAHHTLTLMLCKCTLCVAVELSGHKYLLFCVLMRPQK